MHGDIPAGQIANALKVGEFVAEICFLHTVTLNVLVNNFTLSIN